MYVKALITTILFSIVLSSCFQKKIIEKYDISILINKNINKLNNQDTVRFNFCEINEFEWEDLVIVPPYARMSYLDSLNLINKKDVKNIMDAVEANDFRCIYFFVNKDSIIRYQIFENKEYLVNLYAINFETPKGRISKQLLCEKLYVQKVDSIPVLKM